MKSYIIAAVCIFVALYFGYLSTTHVRYTCLALLAFGFVGVAAFIITYAIKGDD